MPFKACTSGGICVPYSPEEQFQDVAQPVGAIEGMRKSGNLGADVKTVQRLLNQISPEEGGQKGLGKDGAGLAVDGICGSLTRGGIKTFQARQFPGKTPDIIVDPHQRTINRLNQLAMPEVDLFLQAKGRAALPAAALYVTKAIRHLDLARTHYTMPGRFSSFESQAKLVEWHFHLDRSNDRLRDLGTIRGVMQLMLSAVGYIPKGPGQKEAFGFIDTMGKDTVESMPFAYTFGGGYLYLTGQTRKVQGEDVPQRVDQIYLTRRLLDLNERALIYVIMHELAHFVGGQSGDIDHIDDRAYFHRQRARYDKLSPYEAATNADTFAQYIWEVNTRQHFLPAENGI